MSERKGMRRVCAAAVLLLLCTLPGWALEGKLTAGTKAGVTLGFFSGGDWDEHVSALEDAYGIRIREKVDSSFAAGLFAEWGIGPHAALLAELHYTTLGRRYDYKNSDQQVEARYAQRVLQMPLLVKISTQGRTGAFLVLGPTAQLMLGNLTYEERGDGVGADSSDQPDNIFVAGAMGGIGYGIPVLNGIMTVEARYLRNLTSLFSDRAYRLNGVQVTLGYGTVIF